MLRSLALAALAATGLAVAPGAAAAAPIRFAPYADMAEYPPPDLPALEAHGGVGSVSLGFVTAAGGARCAPTWGGYAEYPAAGRHPYRRANVRAFTRKGGRIVVSFGGQAGTELAVACPTVDKLAAAYAKAIKAYGATHVDFDIEGATIADKAANTRRAQAIRRLQAAHPGRLTVSYTVPLLPSGLDRDGVALVRNAKAHGVALALVNGMAMDYGAEAAPHPAGHMADLAIAAGKGMVGQLRRIYPKASTQALRRRVGLTPMIGVNDVSAEIFGLADAGKLVAWARRTHIGRLAMWSVARDRQCAAPSATALNNCSSVKQARFAFSRSLGKFRG